LSYDYFWPVETVLVSFGEEGLFLYGIGADDGTMLKVAGYIPSLS